MTDAITLAIECRTPGDQNFEEPYCGLLRIDTPLMQYLNGRVHLVRELYYRDPQVGFVSFWGVAPWLPRIYPYELMDDLGFVNPGFNDDVSSTSCAVVPPGTLHLVHDEGGIDIDMVKLVVMVRGSSTELHVFWQMNHRHREVKIETQALPYDYFLQLAQEHRIPH